jgi:uridine kinase
MSISTKNIQIQLPGEKFEQHNSGVRIRDVFSDTFSQAIGALANNELVSLSYKLEVDTELKPVFPDSYHGALIYRRSLCYLLAMAATELYPNERLVLGHSLGSGYYYTFEDKFEIQKGECEDLEKKMRELASEDLAIVREKNSYAEAMKILNQSKQRDSIDLLDFRNDSKIITYKTKKYIDIAHGPLAPSTGFLQTFEILPYENGMLLRFPSTKDMQSIPPLQPNPVLFSIYSEYKAWGKIQGFHSVGTLNRRQMEGDLKEVIQIAETLHNKKIAQIADQVLARKKDVKIVLIAGPSSSGKTTFTKKLGIQLRIVGFNPVIVGLDDYFVDRENTPLDAEGNYDFESIEALDLKTLNRDLVDLLEGREIQLPSFDFKSGSRKYTGKTLQMKDRSILLMEGIHGLNDRLTSEVAKSKKFKIYISALTQLNLDDHNRVSTTDNRLIRRMIRDYNFRGHSALRTLEMWPSVRRGEDKNIFPYQNSADAAFNSALDYELGVLKVYAEPLLRSIKPDTPYYAEAARLQDFLSNFLPIPESYVPGNSILREFIGNSEFKY